MDTEFLIKRFNQLVSARKNQDGRMQQLVSVVDPNRYDFFDDLMSESSVQWNQPGIYDNTATIGYKLLAARIHANLMSPVTRWFNIKYRNDELNTNKDAKEWLEDSVQRFWQMLSESDFNHATGEMLKDIVLVGTSPVMQEPVNDLVWEGIKYTAMPVMDSYFEMNPDQTVYRNFRRIRYTREQLQERFPDMPDDLKLEDGEGGVEAKIDVIFCVYERNQEDVGSGDVLEPSKRPIGYKYILRSAAVDLEEGGYYEYPGMVVRWDKTAGTEWGTSPIMNMLENINTLQSAAAHELEWWSKELDPPMKTTERGIAGDLESQSGGITVVTDMDDLDRLFPPSNFNMDNNKIKDLQAMIWSGLYLDQMELKDSPAMTATEVQVRLEQMVRLMSSVVGRIQDDYMKPIIQYGFALMLRMGQFLPMPESVAASDLDIIYTGPISRALQSEVAQGIIQYLTITAELAEIYPTMLDLPDTDAMARKLAELNGVPAATMRSQDEVAEIRMARAEQEAQAMERQAAMEGGQAMESMGKGVQQLQAVNGGEG